jgi:hypothetical protein
LLVRFSPESTHFTAEIIYFIPECRAEFVDCLECLKFTPAIELMRTSGFVVHVMVGCEPWMCESLRDANASGGVETKHFIQEVNGCVGGSTFRTGAGDEIKM